jgi:hypothetical protein
MKIGLNMTFLLGIVDIPLPRVTPGSPRLIRS